MIFFIGGVVVGAVIGGIWGVRRYNNQKQRYTQELEAQNAVKGSKQMVLDKLRQHEAVARRDVESRKGILAKNTQKIDTTKIASDEYVRKAEELREERDDMERQENEQLMTDTFKGLGF